jgi:hypothetical protein
MNPLPPMLFINKLQKYVNNINNMNNNDELIKIKNELNNYMSYHEIIDDGDNTYIINSAKIYIEILYSNQENNRLYLSKIYVDYLVVAYIYFELNTYDTVLHFVESCCEFSKMIKDLIKWLDIYKHDFYINYMKYNKIYK